MTAQRPGSESAFRGTQEKSAEAPLIRLTLPGLPRTPNAREHWAAKASHVRAWRAKVFAAAWPHAPKEPLAQARIVFTRHSSAECDYDNLVASFKACMDGLRQARWIVDDKRKNVGAPEYKWAYAPPRKGFVTIEIYKHTTPAEPERRE